MPTTESQTRIETTSIEQHIPSKPKPGTKEAVLKHFGIFKDDGDLEAQLANIHAQRKAVTDQFILQSATCQVTQ